MYGQLLRPRFDRRIAGVCSAFSNTYGWDLSLVRLVWVLLAIFGGGGVLAYVICWIVIPEEPLGMAPYDAAYGAYPPAGYPPAGAGYPPQNYAPPVQPNYPPTHNASSTETPTVPPAS